MEIYGNILFYVYLYKFMYKYRRLLYKYMRNISIYYISKHCDCISKDINSIYKQFCVKISNNHLLVQYMFI